MFWLLLKTTIDDTNLTKENAASLQNTFFYKAEYLRLLF